MLPALDPTHVGSVKVAMVGEGFLGEPLFPPHFANSGPENNRKFLHLQ